MKPFSTLVAEPLTNVVQYPTSLDRLSIKLKKRPRLVVISSATLQLHRLCKHHMAFGTSESKIISNICRPETPIVKYPRRYYGIPHFPQHTDQLLITLFVLSIRKYFTWIWTQPPLALVSNSPKWMRILMDCGRHVKITRKNNTKSKMALEHL